jgi:hypothetical protein
MGELARVRGRCALNPIQQIHKGTPGEGGLLDFPHLGCRHHLHRFGDLCGAADGLDPSAYIAWALHN